MSTVTCSRCQLERPILDSSPYPGDVGLEIQKKVCRQCWAEWQQAEVIVINELRLDFMDPKSHDTLVLHMREFLGLDRAPSADA